MPLTIVIIAGLAMFVALVYVGLREDRSRDPLQERLAAYGERELPTSLEEVELSLSFRDRVLLPLARKFADLSVKFTPEKQLEDARRLIDLAGLSIPPATFFTMRVGLTIFFALAAFLVFFVASSSIDRSSAILFTIGGGVLGYFLPAMWIRAKIQRRQQAIVRALPDALDLLVICVEAGLGFDAAMGKVYEKWDNDLAIAFGRVLREIQLGKMRREALRDMANRMEVPDVTSFVAAIIQADQLGVSMSTILRVQSDQMRVKRRQRAQEQAHQAPVKMMIPMVFLIFPSLWIVLLGPSVIVLLNLNISI
ncbi:MAG: type II secretion system F family protein [Chloroflexota bacterium]|nr:MAG: type II secretion system protein [Chloroflexota bacterium]